MANARRGPREPAQIHHRLVISRQQRDWIAVAAAALEQHAGHDEDQLAMLEAASELRRVAGAWDAASDSRQSETVQQRLREALCRIANAESGIWGWIARDALDECRALYETDGGGKAITSGHTSTSAPGIPAPTIADRSREQLDR